MFFGHHLSTITLGGDVLFVTLSEKVAMYLFFDK